eukprot:2049136-Karenia_brevis.AAC.1
MAASSGGAGHGADTAFVTKAELTSGLQSLGDKLSASFQKSVSSLNIDISSNITESIADIASKVDSRIGTVERQQHEQGQRIDQHDTSIADIHRRLAAMEAKQ